MGAKETQRTIFLAITLGAQHRGESREAARLVSLASRWISVLCVFLHVSEMENDSQEEEYFGRTSSQKEMWWSVMANT